MNDIQALAANCALQDMLRKGHFSICTIDKINAVTKAIPDGEAYRILALLHCVDYKDMPADLLRGLPLLIQRALGGTTLDFTTPSSFRSLLQ